MKKTLAQELIDNGVIYEVNRTFFHPLGLALYVRGKKVEDGKILFDEDEFGIMDNRHDPEGMIFTKVFPDKTEAFKKFQDEKHKTRKEGLGFIIQEEDCE